MFPKSKSPKKDYRKLLSHLNAAIDTVEINMAKNKWNTIDFTVFCFATGVRPGCGCGWLSSVLVWVWLLVLELEFFFVFLCRCGCLAWAWVWVFWNFFRVSFVRCLFVRLVRLVVFWLVSLVGWFVFVCLFRWFVRCLVVCETPMPKNGCWKPDVSHRCLGCQSALCTMVRWIQPRMD